MAGSRTFVLLATGAWWAAACPAAVTTDLGVYLTSEIRLSHAPAGSFWREGGDASMADLSGVVRPMFSAETGDLDFTVEADFAESVGDTRERLRAAGLAGPANGRHAGNFVDLERMISEGPRHAASARVDRLALAWSLPWGTVTIGRHAITWGGGLVFNPFDLFNPFAPSDVVRDYKNGDDMIHVDLPLTGGGVQALAVGRRDPLTGRAAWDASSFALQAKLLRGANDWTLMGAWHYGEPALGLGVSGGLGEATWHADATWQRVRADGTDRVRDHFSGVANLQYSWVWGGRNVFGVLEYYHSSLGRSDATAALLDPFVATQQRRGNLFVLGRDYLAASLQVEWHPLFNLHLGGMVNLQDPSALLQPRAVWNASDSVQVTFGIDVPVGGRGTEFGGYPAPGLVGDLAQRPSAYGVVSCWF